MATVLPPSTNPLALEPLLVARLQAALADVRPGVHVLVAAELADVLEEKQLVPAVQVMFAGMRPLEAQGGDTRVACDWHTVVAVRHADAKGKGASARASAQALVHATYSALAGWKPEGHSKPLALVAGPGGASSNGFFYLPLTWRTELVWRPTL